eukprot:TRINITY_DN14288_c0_g2_i1.p2 TRINITY_DN14288_c0_g2~~TRINITY_DN14288_c0_g2_i1.p2  ORF type:complete len:116 (+),score=7.55 TRINITY_DN14288_c0_g2_i1:378-725(+)
MNMPRLATSSTEVVRLRKFNLLASAATSAACVRTTHVGPPHPSAMSRATDLLMNKSRLTPHHVDIVYLCNVHLLVVTWSGPACNHMRDYQGEANAKNDHCSNGDDLIFDGKCLSI